MNDAAISDTITLSRTDYEALLDRLENLEDMATLDRLEARLAADPGLARAPRTDA
jgi:hypothetical protein